VGSLKAAGIFLAALIFVPGCAGSNRRPEPDKKLRVLAVMPFENLSNDASGAEITRKKIYDALVNDKYEVMELEKTDAILRGLGVTDGGQLKRVELSKLAAGLGTGTLITGEVQEYFQGASLEVIPFGFCFKRQVKLKITVRDALTGKILFERQKELVTREPLDQQEEKRKQNEKNKRELEKEKRNGGKAGENDTAAGEKEPTFLENLFGGILRNAISDTIYSGAELMAYNIAQELVREMPYFYEE